MLAVPGFVTDGRSLGGVIAVTIQADASHRSTGHRYAGNRENNELGSGRPGSENLLDLQITGGRIVLDPQDRIEGSVIIGSILPRKGPPIGQSLFPLIMLAGA